MLYTSWMMVVSLLQHTSCFENIFSLLPKEAQAILGWNLATLDWEVKITLFYGKWKRNWSREAEALHLVPEYLLAPLPRTLQLPVVKALCLAQCFTVVRRRHVLSSHVVRRHDGVKSPSHSLATTVFFKLTYSKIKFLMCNFMSFNACMDSCSSHHQSGHLIVLSLQNSHAISLWLHNSPYSKPL